LESGFAGLAPPPFWVIEAPVVVLCGQTSLSFEAIRDFGHNGTATSKSIETIRAAFHDVAVDFQQHGKRVGVTIVMPWLPLWNANDRRPIQNAPSRRPRLLGSHDNGPWHGCRNGLEWSHDFLGWRRSKFSPAQRHGADWASARETDVKDGRTCKGYSRRKGPLARVFK
jgi:hypothetical protein